MLNSEMATKAFSAFNSLPIITYTANVARETCKKHSEHFNYVKQNHFKKLSLLNAYTLLPLSTYIQSIHTCDCFHDVA